MKRDTYFAAAIGVGFLLLLGLAGESDYQSMQAIKEPAPLTAKEQKYARFFAEQGSNEPVMMAKVIVKNAKRPRLMAAVAAVESNGNPHAIGKIGEVTAWQIRKEIWGDPGYTLEEQAKSAEIILEELIKEEGGSIRRGLNRYNGDKSGRYSQKVMALVAKL